MERALDRASQQLGIDPAELRRRNLVPSASIPYQVGLLYRDGVPMEYDSGDYPGAFDKALELLEYADFRGEQARARAEGRYIGAGFATYLEATGLGPWEGAKVAIQPGGEVVVFTGTTTQGQAHHTVWAQICADELGVPIEQITVLQGDTTFIPYGKGARASRSTVLAGSAIALAARRVREKALRAAAILLEASPSDLELRHGLISIRGLPGRQVDLATLVDETAVGGLLGDDEEPSLEATHYFRPPTVTFANGVHAAKVEVDPDSGCVKVLKYVVVHDCGRIINPMIVDGQVLGGVAQGIGAALYESIRFDAEGQPANTSLMEYLLPTSLDVPGTLVSHMESPSPRNPLGVKGAGEGGAIGPPSVVAGAVEDALSQFGLRIDTTPVSPDYVRRLVRAAREGLTT
jgi:CO/xanthine dehydrogenase Mo-binding subunit